MHASSVLSSLIGGDGGSTQSPLGTRGQLPHCQMKGIRGTQRVNTFVSPATDTGEGKDR